MPNDVQYIDLPNKLNEVPHKYGEKVHILSDPFIQSLLARIGRPDVHQPLLNTYFDLCYTRLLGHMVNLLFPRVEIDWDTRMKEFNSKGVFRGEIIQPQTRAVIVDLARAGMWPSHICYNILNHILEPKRVRQDHFYLNRKTNQQGEVIGVDVSGSKIGGGQDESFVLFPDPMGATGGSLSYCVQHYKDHVEGKAKRYIALHAIVTSEYIQRMQKDHPDVEIFTMRLDRGLSDQEVLNSLPGTYPEKEKGLNEKQYIIPGAGGVGEILNNSFV
jgi:uracil phosphoribosyltransferase